MLGEFHVTKNALYVESGSINKPLFANQFAANNRCLALRPLTWLPKTRNIKGLVFQVRQRSFRVQIIRAVELYCEVLRPSTVRAMLRDVGLARTPRTQGKSDESYAPRQAHPRHPHSLGTHFHPVEIPVNQSAC